MTPAVVDAPAYPICLTWIETPSAGAVVNTNPVPATVYALAVAVLLGYWVTPSKLTKISSLEGGDSQSRVDVAQSIYNRFADVQSDISDGKMDDAAFDYTKSSFKADESGKFPKLTLSDIILKSTIYWLLFIILMKLKQLILI